MIPSLFNQKALGVHTNLVSIRENIRKVEDSTIIASTNSSTRHLYRRGSSQESSHQFLVTIQIPSERRGRPQGIAVRRSPPISGPSISGRHCSLCALCHWHSEQPLRYLNSYHFYMMKRNGARSFSLNLISKLRLCHVAGVNSDTSVASQAKSSSICCAKSVL